MSSRGTCDDAISKFPVHMYEIATHRFCNARKDIKNANKLKSNHDQNIPQSTL